MSELLTIDYEEGPSLRVLHDGRFEFKSDVEPYVDAQGRPATRSVRMEWREQWVYTPEELQEVRQALAQADDPPLEPRYGSRSEGRRMQHVRWRLQTGSRVADVDVVGYPAVRVPALERLFHRLYEIHQVPGETTVWRLCTPQGPVEKLVPCEASGVPVLRGLVEALFARPLGERGETTPPPDEEPLVEVTFRREGEVVERTLVTVAGRFYEIRDGVARERAPLRGHELQELRDALAGTDWAALPARLC